MPTQGSVRTSPRTAVVWEALSHLLEERRRVSDDPVSVVDLGGGTGGFAVPLAASGHDVTVVDESADALATLQRRASEHGVSVRGVQGDAGDLAASVASASADLVLCHNVLEYVDDPQATLAAVHEVLRAGGAVSVLAPNRSAAVVHRALAGRFAEASHALADGRGSWGELDPVPRRFSLEQVVGLLADTGFVPGAVHGVRVFTDLVPGGLAEAEPGGAAALLALERAAAEDAELRCLATSVHAVGARGDGGGQPRG